MTSPPPPVGTVDRWSCPTSIQAGHGVIGRLAEAVGDRAALLVLDRGILGAGVAEQVRGAAGASRELVVHDPVGQESELLQHLRARPGDAVIAVGGGGVLDMARSAALAVAEPGFAAMLRAGAAGPALWPSAGTNPVIAVPTTLGTAAEVSPVAVRRRGGAAAMLVSPALRATHAFLDPVATATLPRAAATAGLVEPLARVLVPALASGELGLQDALAAAHVAVVLRLGDDLPAARGGGLLADADADGSWRLTAALTSTSTHTAFLAVGRPPAAHALWPLATELMTATGATKAEALAVLLPCWLRLLATGQLPRGPGRPERAGVITGMAAADLAERIGEWMPAAVPGAGQRLAGADAEAVAAGVLLRWRGPLFLTDVPADAIRLICRETVAAARRGPG